MNTYDLTGRVAVVTGGAQGIGLAVAQRLRASGARIALWDFNEGKLEEARGTLGEQTLCIRVDITDAEAVAAAARQTEQHFGSLDILINSAGIAGQNAPLDEYDLDEWRKVIDVDLNGTFYANRAVVPGMKRRGYGRIVNIASIAGKEGNPNASAYSSAKAGVIGLTKSLGKELAGLNIAVNCVTPATADTAILKELKPEFIQYMLSKIPRARLLDLSEAASMITWLVSEENSFTTGAVFDLSGGRATY